MDRMLASVGVNPRQWRALVWAFLVMDLRRSGGLTRPGERPSSGVWPLVGLLTIIGLNSLTFAILAVYIEDLLTGAILLTTGAALGIGMLLMVDFTGLVVSPDDAPVLGARPVDSRTYFAARMAAILAYVLAVSVVFASVPALVFGIWRALGLAALLATLLAVVLCNVCATVVVIAGYAALIGRVHPRKVTRVLSYAQLAVTTVFFGTYYLVTVGIEGSGLTSFSVRDSPWLWVNPAAWFAAFVPLAAGVGERPEWLAAGAASALTLVSIPVAAGQLSLDYAERLAELTATSEPPRSSRRSPLVRVPGFRSGEPHAIALLIGAQFRYDMRFRLAVLSLLPITIFYLLLGLGEGSLDDPFTPPHEFGSSPLYFVVCFLPLTLHSALQSSESWRAAWIYFASPADPARLVVAAKNFVAIWFIGGYLVFLAAVWSFFYDRVWHAIAHAIVVGLLAHLFLQIAALLHPVLPFATEPKRVERSTGLFTLMFFGGMMGGMIPVLLPFVYARPIWSTGFIVLLLGATAAVEHLLRRRAVRMARDLEFVS
jgi:hypothetical protein